MCLMKVSKITEEISNIKEGYKVFTRKRILRRDRLFPVYMGLNFPLGINKRRWINSKGQSERHSRICYRYGRNGKYYRSGWHVFLSIEAAMRWRSAHSHFSGISRSPIHRVLVKDIVAAGHQEDAKSVDCIVCRQIYIMEEVN
jgi:hypothetical protein